MMQNLEGKDILHKAFALQDAIQDLPEDERLSKEDMEPIHYFAEGMYLRSLFIPEGIAVVGEMHRHSHFTILAEGTSTIVSQDGEFKVQAPFVFTSTPYAKRCVYADTDCTWITVHLNLDNSTDTEEVAQRHIITDKKELLEILQ
jgi:hypothetical protein